MIETRAVVIKVEGREALVETVQGGGCGACGGGGSCGSGKLAQAFRVRPRRFRARNDADARVGEEVEIAVKDGALFESALTLYGLPLATLFAGAVAGSFWLRGAGSDGGAVIGAVAGLVAGFVLAASLAARRRQAGFGALPSISRRNPAGQQLFPH